MSPRPVVASDSGCSEQPHSGLARGQRVRSGAGTALNKGLSVKFPLTGLETVQGSSHAIHIGEEVVLVDVLCCRIQRVGEWGHLQV